MSLDWVIVGAESRMLGAHEQKINYVINNGIPKTHTYTASFNTALSWNNSKSNLGTQVASPRLQRRFDLARPEWKALHERLITQTLVAGSHTLPGTNIPKNPTPGLLGAILTQQNTTLLQVYLYNPLPIVTYMSYNTAPQEDL